MPLLSYSPAKLHLLPSLTIQSISTTDGKTNGYHNTCIHSRTRTKPDLYRFFGFQTLSSRTWRSITIIYSMKRRKLERDREMHTFTPEQQQKFPRRIRTFTNFFGFQTLPSRSRRNITIMYSMKTRKLEREMHRSFFTRERQHKLLRQTRIFTDFFRFRTL
jgi:hypothetical protein